MSAIAPLSPLFRSVTEWLLAKLIESVGAARHNGRTANAEADHRDEHRFMELFASQSAIACFGLPGDGSAAALLELGHIAEDRLNGRGPR